MLRLAIVSLCCSLVACQLSMPQLAQGGLSTSGGAAQLAQGGIALGNSAVQLGGRLAGQGSAAAAATAKQVADAVAAFRAAALQGGVDVIKQAIDMGGRMAANIPVVGPAVGLGAGALKAGADLVNGLGQAAIGAKQNLTKIKVDAVDGAVRAGAAALIQAANASAAAAGGAAANATAIREAGQVTTTTTTSRPAFNPDIDLWYR